MVHPQISRVFSGVVSRSRLSGLEGRGFVSSGLLAWSPEGVGVEVPGSISIRKASQHQLWRLSA